MKALPLLLPILIVSLFFFSFASAEEEDILDILTEMAMVTEKEEMLADLDSWVDEKTVEFLSGRALEEDDIKALYQKFKDTIVSPPDPDNYAEYSIENVEETLVRVEELGREMHNIFLTMAGEKFKKYSRLIGKMRDVLYVDWKHIPYAIRHDNVRALYWHKVHTLWLEEVEREYSRLFGDE